MGLVPHGAWHRRAKNRKLPPGSISQPVSAEVPARSEKALDAHPVLKVKVWIGVLASSPEASCSYGADGDALLQFLYSGSATPGLSCPSALFEAESGTVSPLCSLAWPNSCNEAPLQPHISSRSWGARIPGLELRSFSSPLLDAWQGLNRLAWARNDPDLDGEPLDQEDDAALPGNPVHQVLLQMFHAHDEQGTQAGKSLSIVRMEVVRGPSQVQTKPGHLRKAIAIGLGP